MDEEYTLSEEEILLTTTSEYDLESYLSAIEEKGKLLLDFSKNVIENDDELKGNIKDEKIIKSLLYRIKDTSIKVLVCGSVNSGKSSLLNNLIKNCNFVLPSYCGHCTPCCITIQCTNDNHGYLQKGSSSAKMSLVCLKNLGDIQESTSDENVYVFLPNSDSLGCILRCDNIRVTELPGLENNSINNRIPELEKSDVCVVVVDSNTKLDKEKVSHELSICNRILSPTVLVVYSKWDGTSNEGNDRIAKQKSELMKDAVEFLVKEKIYSSEEMAKEAVFFLSSNDVSVAQYSDSLSHLEDDIINSSGNIGKKSTVIVGTDGVGKSTLANLLLGQDFLPTNNADTPRFITFRTVAKNCSWIDGYERKFGIEELNKLSDSNQAPPEETRRPLFVNISERDIKDSRLLCAGFEITDSPSIYRKAFRSCSDIWKKASAIIIVVSALKSSEIMKEQILTALFSIKNCEDINLLQFYLVVSSWDQYLLKKEDPTNRTYESRENKQTKIREMFKSCLKEAEILMASGMCFVYFFSQSSGNRIGKNFAEFCRFEEQLKQMADLECKARKIEERLDEIANETSVNIEQRRVKLLSFENTFKHLIHICDTIKQKLEEERTKKQGVLQSLIAKIDSQKSNEDDIAIRFIKEKYIPFEENESVNSSFVNDEEECQWTYSVSWSSVSNQDTIQLIETINNQETTQYDLSYEPPKNASALENACDQFLKFCEDDPEGHVKLIQLKILYKLYETHEDEFFKTFVADRFKECVEKNSNYKDFTYNANLRQRNESELLKTQEEKGKERMKSGALTGAIPAAVAGVAAGVPSGIGVGSAIGGVSGWVAGPVGAAVGVAAGAMIGAIGGVVGGLIYHKKLHLKARQKLFSRMLREIHDEWIMEIQLQTFATFQEHLTNLNALINSLEEYMLDFHRNYFEIDVSSYDQLLLKFASGDDQHLNTPNYHFYYSSELSRY